MHSSCYFDGQIVSLQPSLNALSSAALHGKGIFTTIAIHNGKPVLWEKHWTRLDDNAARLKIDLAGLTEQSTLSAVTHVVEANNVEDGRTRITIFDRSSSSIWPFPSKGGTSLLITSSENRPRPKQLRLTFSPYPINSSSPLSGIKSCNYLENLIAIEAASERDFDEAVRLNERGEVASACMANIFWVRGEKVYTPSVPTGCLPGTTRAFVMENRQCVETACKREDMLTADSVFLTSAGLGVSAVSEIDGKKFEIEDHEISKLMALLLK